MITKVKIEGEPELRLVKEGETVTEVIHGGALFMFPVAWLGSQSTV